MCSKGDIEPLNNTKQYSHPAVKQHNYTLLFITSGLGEGWFQNQAINSY